MTASFSVWMDGMAGLGGVCVFVCPTGTGETRGRCNTWLTTVTVSDGHVRVWSVPAAFVSRMTLVVPAQVRQKCLGRRLQQAA